MNINNKKVITLYDWDQFISETYGRPYSFQQQDGCKERGLETIFASKEGLKDDFYPDSVPELINGDEMGVNFKAWLARDPKQPIANQKHDWELSLFWERNFYPHVEMIACDLCKRGLLEEGEYLINIDW